MPTPKKPRTLDRINVPVLTKHKSMLEDYMRKEGYDTQGDALMGMIEEHAKMAKRIKQLEQQLKDAGITPAAEEVKE